jgi:hypothetical protein
MPSFIDDLAKGDVIHGTAKKYFGNHRTKPEDFLDDSLLMVIGFVAVDGGRDFFIHLNQGLELYSGIHLDILSSPNQTIPKVGDRIGFNLTVGTKNQKARANNWVFKKNFTEAQGTIAKYKKFRIIAKGSSPVKVVWDGSKRIFGLNLWSI